MKDKIEYRYEIERDGKVTSGRLSSALLDLNDITNYPFSGRGFSQDTRSDDKYYMGRSNGLTALAVIYAPFGFLLYFLAFKNFALEVVIKRWLLNILKIKCYF